MTDDSPSRPDDTEEPTTEPPADPVEPDDPAAASETDEDA